MRFREPFGDAQWEIAAERHRTMRLHLQEVRRRFPPRSDEEARVLREYRDLIQDLGRELQKPHDRINAERLNDLSEEAVFVFASYASIRSLK